MNKKISIKVCGIKQRSNRTDLEQLPVDYFGFIFYPGSKRYVGDPPEEGLFETTKKKVAVFVNYGIENITDIINRYSFKFVQLHGNEDPATCFKLRNKGLSVIKAINLHDKFEFSILKEYEGATDFFLFDTKSDLPGGSGEKFNWKILAGYSGKVPFFLSGGIGPSDAKIIQEISHPELFGIDVNSGFENEPGIKNIEKLNFFLNKLYELPCK
ncbi:MAG: phosphoribosylanthranilate isomerase [Bacteroidales bacterium]|jgi:phosphoribosylanthranilate isomerase|nr:phosphoribosylanthranilate isomerase [Bacteroidales bacterium]